MILLNSTIKSKPEVNTASKEKEMKQHQNLPHNASFVLGELLLPPRIILGVHWGGGHLATATPLPLIVNSFFCLPFTGPTCLLPLPGRFNSLVHKVTARGDLMAHEQSTVYSGKTCSCSS